MIETNAELLEELKEQTAQGFLWFTVNHIAYTVCLFQIRPVITLLLLLSCDTTDMQSRMGLGSKRCRIAMISNRLKN